LIGGAFTTYNSITTLRLIRLDQYGLKDTTFSTGTFAGVTTPSVNAIEVQSDGKILIGGNFTIYNSVTTNFIIRFNTDGTRDNTFNIGTGFNGSVGYIKLQSDNKIIVAGTFSSYNGTTKNKFIRLNSNGSVDNTFDVGTGAGTAVVDSVTMQSDDKLIIGGRFTTFNGTSAPRIVRLNTDGSVDNTFNAGTGFDIGPNSLNVQSDGKILATGSFNTYNGFNFTGLRLLRLNSDGSRDTSFNVTESGGTNGTIIYPNDKIIVLGNSNSKIVKLNSDGTVDTSFNPGTGFNPNDTGDFRSPFGGLVLPNGQLLVTGRFTEYNGVTLGRIAILNPDGSLVDCIPSPTPTPTPSVTSTPELTPTPTPSSTGEPVTPTPTPTPTSTSSVEPVTPTPTPSVTSTITPTPTPSTTSELVTPTPTPSVTSSPTPTPSGLPYTQYTIYMQTGVAPLGWENQSDACEGTGSPITVYVNGTGFSSLFDAVVTAGEPLYTGTTFVSGNLYVGQDKWYKDQQSPGGNVFTIGNDGAVALWATCPSPTPTPTPSNTPVSPTPTPTNTVTPTPTPSPSPLPTLYVSDLRPTCSDFCTTNYTIPLLKSATSDYFSIGPGDIIYDLSASAGFYAISNISTDTDTGPFKVVEVDSSGEVLSVLVCFGGECEPL
jgi:uncharacterized delta-60 repeat protein